MSELRTAVSIRYEPERSVCNPESGHWWGACQYDREGEGTGEGGVRGGEAGEAHGHRLRQCAVEAYQSLG